MHEHQFEYEVLTNSQFQALAAALIVREHPRTQCMPLSGRDGGRDVVVQTVEDGQSASDSLVYQVKMRQKSVTGVPTAEDLYRWIVAHLKGEIVKISRLAARGAKEYVLVTNIPASGDLETGLRDRVHQFMAENIAIPCTSWWREDLDTRLRAYPDIAATHGLLIGYDALRGLISSDVTKRSRLASAELDVAAKAVTAYFADQYRQERFMRFSQADLDPVPLFDLFVDVVRAEKYVRAGQEASACDRSPSGMIAARAGPLRLPRRLPRLRRATAIAHDRP